jgi:hypothetical protein
MSDIHPALSGIELAVDEATSPIPGKYQLALTEDAAEYLNQRWRVEVSLQLNKHKKNVKMNEKPKTIGASVSLEQDMLDELQMIALCLAEAATTHRKMIPHVRRTHSWHLTSHQVEQTGKCRHMPKL